MLNKNVMLTVDLEQYNTVEVNLNDASTETFILSKTVTATSSPSRTALCSCDIMGMWPDEPAWVIRSKYELILAIV